MLQPPAPQIRHDGVVLIPSPHASPVGASRLASARSTLRQRPAERASTSLDRPCNQRHLRVSTTSIIRYLADCRQEDGATAGVWNLLRVPPKERKHLHDCTDLLDGTVNEVHIDGAAWHERCRNVAQYKSRERQIIFGTLFIAGRVNLPSQPRRKMICAPLFIAPLKPAPPGSDLHEVAMDSIRLNTAVVEAVLGAMETAPPLDAVIDCLAPPPWTTADLIQMSYRLGQLLPQVDTAPLRELSEPTNQTRLDKATKKSGLRCLNAGITAIIDNSPMEASILHELDLLQVIHPLSPPLEALLGDQHPPARELHPEVVPLDLSEAQQGALHSAATHPLTVLVGPPGTGKSFTLCAIALEHLLRGESVLIACRSQGAVDVLSEKLAGLLGESGFVLRGGKGAYAKAMRAFLDRSIAGRAPFTRFDDPPSQQLELQLAESAERLLALRTRWVNTQKDSTTWATLDASEPSWWLTSAWRSYRRGKTEERLDSSPPAWELLDEHQREVRQRQSLLAALMRARIRERFLHAHQNPGWRKTIKGVSKAIRASNSGLQAERFAALDFDRVHHLFPLWMTDLGTIHRLAPLQSELFDVVLIDEATHCDGASALPVLARGTRAVVTGDPAQLRHIPFIAREHQERIAREQSLTPDQAERFDYRKKSLLDIALDAVPSGDQVHFLDEHFRSRPDIIAFANQEFYNGDLRVMTWRPHDARLPALVFHRTSGTRGKNGVNTTEVRAVIDFLKARVESERTLPVTMKSSIGVLSPFRAQVEALEEAIGEALASEIRTHHHLRVDTPHGFQGHERDLMVLSMAIGKGANPASLRYLERPDVFNVSITRARSEQHVFASTDGRGLPSGSLLGTYLDSLTSQPPSPPSGDLVRDAFGEEVCEALQQAGHAVFQRAVRAGMALDILVVQGSRSLAVDLVGYEGPLSDAYPRDRIAILGRAGIPVFPLPLASWKRDRDAVLSVLAKRLTG